MDPLEIYHKLLFSLSMLDLPQKQITNKFSKKQKMEEAEEEKEKE